MPLADIGIISCKSNRKSNEILYGGYRCLLRRLPRLITTVPRRNPRRRIPAAAWHQRFRLTKSIGVSETAIGEIVNGKRRITTAMAWGLSKALGTSPEFWANLQTDYDLLTFDSSSLGDIHPLVEA
ncbi:HigA family addiction module antitoxin [Bifidobacterium saguinibicoloris]|uniref:HigA family addiction module antitoxin n=1 Tax=Bifidobacterium saguinibicoloris TaxID=2834433 RepID=UPI001F263806|nr:HigA family addiction module antitoxin [Bifidobacterium saguinibicoloris]